MKEKQLINITKKDERRIGGKKGQEEKTSKKNRRSVEFEVKIKSEERKMRNSLKMSRKKKKIKRGNGKR